VPPVITGVIDFGLANPSSIAFSPTRSFAYIAECLCDQDHFNVTWIVDTNSGSEPATRDRHHTRWELYLRHQLRCQFCQRH
jgi:hypothetical protein